MTLHKSSNASDLIYHVTKATLRQPILKDGLLAKSGSWYEHDWSSRVFFATTLVGAYEFGMNFKDELIIIVVDKRRVASSFHPDEFFDLGTWTPESVPADAIAEVIDFDIDFLESDEFQRHMGIE